MILNSLKIQDENGNIYSFTDKKDNNIREIHYCTSYFQFEVQLLKEDGTFEKKSLIYTNENFNSLDFIFINNIEICTIL